MRLIQGRTRCLVDVNMVGGWELVVDSETIFDAVYEMMNEVDPGAYPLFS